MFSRTPDTGNYVITKFEEVPSVQTYLIAFVVSDFLYEEDASTARIPHRVYAKPESILNHEAMLAVDSSIKFITKFEEYLGVNYPLPKMDQFAVPDFAAGAMENWGLVTYREPYVLYNETTGTAKNRENVIAVIAHEYAVSPAMSSSIRLFNDMITFIVPYKRLL